MQAGLFLRSRKTTRAGRQICLNKLRSLPPKFHLLLRDEENGTSLRDATHPLAPLDSFKFIPLNKKDPESFLSLGGEVREWFEHFDNEGWGTIPAGDNYVLQRYMAHADVHFSKQVRMFFQVKSGLETYRKVGPRPFDEDRLDFNQGYLDLNFGVQPNTSAQNISAEATGTASGDDLHPLIVLRLGRQELNFGSGRLISVSEGVNVRFGFDAARVILQPANWRIDVFYAKPDAYNLGVMDDGPTTSQTLAGVYATTPLRRLPRSALDLYYLASDFKEAQVVQGVGRDHRQTLGARLSNVNPSSPWNYDVEGTYQLGTFKARAPDPSGVIRAWGISPFASYGFLSTKLRPRIALNGGVTSGDKDSKDGRLQTFSGLFARGDYFGKSNQIGPVNVASFQPEISLTFSRGFRAVLDANWLWRESTHDGLYAAAGVPVRSAGNSDAHFVGTAPEAQLTWQRSNRLSFDLIYQRYLVGRYLHQQRPGGSDLNYAATYATYRF